MNFDETVRYVAACRAAMPGWTPVEGTAEIWHAAAFADIDLADAQTALMQWVSDEGGWPDAAKLRKRAVAASRVRAGIVRREQLGGKPGICGVPGCGCAPLPPEIQRANTRALEQSLRGVFGRVR